ncbi:unnamed protein product [Moneuplotes crassus]|uniref:Uncharacterized protein n=1 Tax=Euplotes crassus TaxID=5936 RepID=A0AAD1U938_EUPCR|nr:unnamed protein product [Moneuplotes crassus]
MINQQCQDSLCTQSVEVFVEQVGQYYCGPCAGLLHSDKPHTHIPNPRTSYSCIEEGYHILDKIKAMKDTKNLGNAWSQYLSDLKELEIELEDLRGRYYKIKDKRTLIDLPSLQTDCFNCITRLYESEAMQAYVREQMTLGMKLSKDQVEYCPSKKSKNQRKAELTALVNEVDLLAKDSIPVLNVEETNPSELKVKLDDIATSLEQLKSRESQQVIHEDRKYNEDEASKEIEEMKHEIEDLTQKLNDQTPIPTHESFNELYAKVTGETGKVFTSGSSITFDLSKSSFQTLMKCFQHYKLPELNSVYISNINKFNQPLIITNFMKNAIHSKIKQFYFNFTPNTDNNFSANFSLNYFEALKKVASVIPDYFFYVINFTLSQTEYQDLLVAARKCKTVCTYYCDIEINEECNFGTRLDDAKFTNLRFYQTGDEKHGDWKREGFVQFKNLIAGLSKVQYVRDTKVDIYLDQCGMTKAEARQMLDTVGLKKMNPTGIS